MHLRTITLRFTARSSLYKETHWIKVVKVTSALTWSDMEVSKKWDAKSRKWDLVCLFGNARSSLFQSFLIHKLSMLDYGTESWLPQRNLFMIWQWPILSLRELYAIQCRVFSSNELVFMQNIVCVLMQGSLSEDT
jgi:hypothetical protein